jgi:hypothetical protein
MRGCIAQRAAKARAASVDRRRVPTVLAAACRQGQSEQAPHDTRLRSPGRHAQRLKPPSHFILHRGIEQLCGCILEEYADVRQAPAR